MIITNLSAFDTTGNRLAAGFDATRQRIALACRQAGREPAEIRLLAVSKGQPAAALEAAYALGQRDFGENYLNEALTKIEALPADCVWHFIGPIQSNKTAAIAAHFAWVHSVDRARIARRLSAQRPATLPALQVCIQVRIGGEDSKAGIEPAELAPLAEEIRALPRLHLAGLMCIPRPSSDPAEQKHQFAQLRTLRDTLEPPPPELSMGMSGDLEAAVASGSTCLRIGTALFGPRSQGKAER